MDAVVKAQNLVVSYGKHVALRLDDFRIGAEAGVVGLFGPNGAGKSTLLRTIVGDIARIQGKIVAPHRVVVSYLPDEPFLYPWLRVSQCVDLFRSRYDDFRTGAFEEFLEGASFSSSAKVSELSKGMSERLHLALIMSRAPKLYVLDEPLAGVDPLTRDHLLALIKKYRIPSAPLLLSTHLINGVDSIFDEIVLISDGKLLTHDTASHLRDFGDGDLELAYKRSVSGHVKND